MIITIMRYIKRYIYLEKGEIIIIIIIRLTILNGCSIVVGRL